MGMIYHNGLPYCGGGSSSPSAEKELTYAEYLALTEEEKNNGTTYYITDAGSTSVQPSIEVDTTLSVEGAAADAKAVGDAIAELRALINSINIQYLNTTEDMVQIKGADGNWHDWATGGLKNRYLFKNGDQCIDITGGWVYTKTSGTCEGSITETMNLSGTGVAGASGICQYATKNVVDFSGFSKLRVEYTELYCGRSGHASNNSTINFYIAGVKVATLNQDSEAQGILEINISNISANSALSYTTNGYDYGTATIKVNNIWLTNQEVNYGDFR